MANLENLLKMPKLSYPIKKRPAMVVYTSVKGFFNCVYIYSLVSSKTHVLFISTLLVAFWKIKFISSDTELSLEIILSFLSINLILLAAIIFPDTVSKVSKYGVFSGPYFAVFSQNTGKYGPEKTPYLDAFHAVRKVIVEYYSKYSLMQYLLFLFLSSEFFD